MNEEKYVPTPFQVFEHEITKPILLDALKGVTPAWYRSTDLRELLKPWAESVNRPVPSVKEVGQAIHRFLKPERRSSHGHVAVWRLTEEMTAGPEVE